MIVFIAHPRWRYRQSSQEGDHRADAVVATVTDRSASPPRLAGRSTAVQPTPSPNAADATAAEPVTRAHRLD